MEWWGKLLSGISKPISDNVGKIVISRTQFIRFSKIALKGLVVLFIGFGFIMAIKSGNEALTNKILDFSIFARNLPRLPLKGR